MTAWWENKTIDELDERKVLVVMKSSTRLVGYLYVKDDVAYIPLHPLRTLVPVFKKLMTSKRNGVELRSDLIKCVELLDPDEDAIKVRKGDIVDFAADENTIRIDDIKAVRVGDVAVFEHVRGEVVETDNHSNDGRRLRVSIPEDEGVGSWLNDSAFRYALRRKPEWPAEPGFYQLSDGRIVMATRQPYGMHLKTLTDENGMPDTIYEEFSENDAQAQHRLIQLTPLTRVKFTPEEETK